MPKRRHQIRAPCGCGIDGIELPYWQKMAENYWGLSVIEPLYDRLIAFDSTSQGAAQLVYRAHLRTLYIEKLRELIAFGGEAYTAVLGADEDATSVPGQ
jgi:hypothetical protein